MLFKGWIEMAAAKISEHSVPVTDLLNLKRPFSSSSQT